MRRYICILLLCVVFLAILPVPVSAKDKFDGQYIGKATVLDMEVPTTINIYGSVFWGSGTLDTDKSSSGSWGAINSLSAKIHVHFDFTTDGDVDDNGGVNGTIRGTFSIQADNKMVGEFNNTFSGTIKDGMFRCNPTITIKITECVGMSCKDNQSGTVSISLVKTVQTNNNDSGIVFTAMKGSVEIRPDVDKRGWQASFLQTKLPYMTHIRTLDGATATLKFPNGDTIVLKPNTEIMIDYPNGNTSKEKVLAGSVKAIIIKKDQDASLEIDMDEAVCEVKGTTLVLEATTDKSKLKVIEGTVSFKSKADGKTATVTGGETISADKNGLGSKTKFDVAAENAKWADSGSTSQTVSSGNNTQTGKKPGIALPKCPITTALEVGPTSPRLTIFRNFRDKVLSKSMAGTQLIALYYQTGTWITDNILNTETARSLARTTVIEPLSLALNGSSFIWNN
jgi:hypothetical protein